MNELAFVFISGLYPLLETCWLMCFISPNWVLLDWVISCHLCHKDKKKEKALSSSSRRQIKAVKAVICATTGSYSTITHYVTSFMTARHCGLLRLTMGYHVLPGVGNCGNRALFGQRAAEIRVNKCMCVTFLHSEHCVFIALFDKIVQVCVCVLGRVFLYVSVVSMVRYFCSNIWEGERAILHSLYWFLSSHLSAHTHTLTSFFPFSCAPFYSPRFFFLFYFLLHLYEANFAK